ncbi:MAG TPA: hypothetical protein EYO62_00255 [Aquificales bacterium]|nr:hypothetical protein [Aquificales bacterium]HIO41722.1 hypothetical protein [Aquifex sp.]
MSLQSSFFIYLYLAVIGFITILGGIFWFLKKRYGNILFLTQGDIELAPDFRMKIKKVLPFMGEGYLIFVEIETPREKYFEVWGYSKSGGFVKISKIGD